MDSTEKSILNHAIKYKELYYKTPWWKFRKRREYYETWQSGLTMFVKYYS